MNHPWKNHGKVTAAKHPAHCFRTLKFSFWLTEGQLLAVSSHGREGSGRKEKGRDKERKREVEGGG